MEKNHLRPFSPFPAPQKSPKKGHWTTIFVSYFQWAIIKGFSYEFRAFKEWILTMDDKSKSSLPSHPLAVSILHKYVYVFPKEIPACLPPKREIRHHINLILGAKLLNKPTYKMNPENSMEIQRPVEELVSKGLVWEFLSRCAVPALLVPNKDGSMHMCVDSRAISKITIKYRYLIPRLEDMLDELHG